MLSNAQIEQLCNDIDRLLGLWDGALSQLHTEEPTDDDCEKAQNYIDQALSLTRRLNMSVTVKSHGAESHLTHQMRTVPGGLFEFDESWGEQAHQIGYSADMRLRCHGGEARKAKVRAADARRKENPQTREELERVRARKRGKRKSTVEKEERKKEVKLERREKSLHYKS